jgi:hypothetical protein
MLGFEDTERGGDSPEPPEPRWRTGESKRHAIVLVRVGGKSTTEGSQNLLGVSVVSSRSSMNQTDGEAHALSVDERDELHWLRVENQMLRMEREQPATYGTLVVDGCGDDDQWAGGC